MRVFPCLCSAAAALLVAAACSGPQAPPFKPVADNKLLMTAVMDPAADVVWGSVGTIIDASGVNDVRPRTDAEWATVRNAAVTVMESGNLIMMPPRARDGGEWMRVSVAMIDKSNEIVQAVDQKDADRVFVLGGELFDICTNCHSKYMEAVVKANQ